MSITFDGEQSKLGTTKQFYHCCDNPDCFYCDGTGEASYTETNGSINFSNANALSILACVNEVEPEGVWTLSELPNIQRKLLKAINTNKTVNNNIRESESYNNFHSFGLSNNDLKERLIRLSELVKTCIDKKSELYWG